MPEDLDSTFRAVLVSKHGHYNFDDPDKIIIHAIAEYYFGTHGRIFSADEYLKREQMSMHSIITPSGINFRLRNDDQCAWHTKHHNKVAFGIAFLVPGVHTDESLREAIKDDYVSIPQYDAGFEQVGQWLDTYQVIEKLDKHSDLSDEPDPGYGFPWDEFNKDLAL